RLANLVAELLVAEIGRDPEPRRAARGLHLSRPGLDLLAHRHHADLLGRQPEWQLAGRVLEEDRDEALERPEHGAMEHHRRGLGALGRDVAEPEALGHRAVDLYGGERPRALEDVAEVEADLGAVERALARQHRDRVARLLGGPRERLLGRVPELDPAEE